MLANSKNQLTTKRLNEKDVLINLPANSIDSINTVIVLELNEKPAVDSVRFIAPNVMETRLLAFDAMLNGNGFGFGDGKTNRYYVDGWKSLEQSVSWKFRLSKAAP